MRVIFFASSMYALPALDKLIERGHEIVLTVTQPDRPSGRRGLKNLPNIVGAHAFELGLPILKPEVANNALEAFEASKADISVVCAFGQILGGPILNATRLGAVNIHFSNLPKHRGAAPVQRAIMNGEAKSGVSIMALDTGLDTGDILQSQSISIGGDLSASSVFSTMANIGAMLLCDTLDDYSNVYKGRLKQNDNESSYANKIEKSERFVNFRESAFQTHNRIRALDRTPGAYGILNSKRVMLFGSHYHESQTHTNDDAVEPGQVLGLEGDMLVIKCLNGEIAVSSLKAEGKTEISGKQFYQGLRGMNPVFGEKL